jgi:phosphoenolpyruvate phosphomutase / 2-hydroxyethylphosphonate cytidylyltransferase
MKKKTAYVGIAGDILHEGHINILKTASKYGDVIVGLLTDKAIASYKRIPFLNYKNRELILKNLKFVNKVIPQNTLDYSENLIKIKPDFFVHGDDWKTRRSVKNKIRSYKRIKEMEWKINRTKIF